MQAAEGAGEGGARVWGEGERGGGGRGGKWCQVCTDLARRP